jgi:hypothetical protein
MACENDRNVSMRRRNAARRGRLAALIVLSLGLVSCDEGSPVGPERYGVPFLIVQCLPQSAVTLGCTARVSCSLYPCRPNLPTDATRDATWTVQDPGILQGESPGRFSAVGIGHTVVEAWFGSTSGRKSVSVFAGLPPQPTFEIRGHVYELGKSAAEGQIPGARVEVVEGLLQGTSVTTGEQPPLTPGFVDTPLSPGTFRLVSVPPGRYLLRISKPGYLSQDREVSAGEAPAVYLTRL